MGESTRLVTHTHTLTRILIEILGENNCGYLFFDEFNCRGHDERARDLAYLEALRVELENDSHGRELVANGPPIGVPGDYKHAAVFRFRGD